MLVLLTTFDQENWGQLLPYAQEVLDVLTVCKPLLNINELMHLWAQVHAPPLTS